VAEPAGIFGETRGTIQGNALRGYSASITTSELMMLEHASSTFTGTGLVMNFGNTTGSFNASTSRFLDLQKAGVSQFTIMHDGRVGIGTSSPQWGITVASTSPILALSDTDAGTNLKNWLLGNYNGSFILGTTTDALGAATSSALLITNDGRYGFGSSTPAGRFGFSASGASGSEAVFVVGSQTGGTYFSVTGNGNVGVGTIAPTNKFNVVGNSQIDSGYLYTAGTGQTQVLFASSINYGTIQNDSANTWSLGYKSNNSTSVGTPTLTWTSDNKVGIGTTSPWAKLSVVSASTSNETNP
jgi:hypothetical protein